jgi:hypothetical protein
LDVVAYWIDGHSPALMTLHWKINHLECLVTLSTADALRFDEIEAYHRDLIDEHALSYRKLFDARAGSTALREEEIESYVSTVSRYSWRQELGPLAVVVGPDEGRAHDVMLSRLLLNRHRPIRMFFDLAEAHDWLKAQMVPGAPSL